MDLLLLGFFTGLSLILAIGAQNIFVIEQGLKKQHIFFVCLICSLSDLILIFVGIFLFHYFVQYFNSTIELIFNILLIGFLIHFIYSKIKIFNTNVSLQNDHNNISKYDIFFKTLGFTYLNPHVYSDTVFILGNFSKNFTLENKLYFAFGASFASIIFFYCLGYLSSIFANFIKKNNSWKYINYFIITFMSILVIYIGTDIILNLLKFY